MTTYSEVQEAQERAQAVIDDYLAERGYTARSPTPSGERWYLSKSDGDKIWTISRMDRALRLARVQETQ